MVYKVSGDGDPRIYILEKNEKKKGTWSGLGASSKK